MARRQDAAVRAITAAEGIVIFDDESNSLATNASGTAPSSLGRLRKSVGEDYFRSVEAVDFATNLGRRRGTAEPKATDKSLALLQGVPDVAVVELSHNETVTDETLVHLSGLRNLKTLYLYHTAVRGPGLVNLTRLPGLEHLELSHTPLVDEGLKHIGQMSRLKSLRLAHTSITDEGVAQLAGLKNLQELSLKYTDITDKSLVHLQRLSQLKELALNGTKVSAEGTERIKQALPGCNVLVSFGLGQTPTDLALFPDSQQPSADEINSKFKELGIDGHVFVDQAQPGKLIIQLYLGQTTLSDAAALKLIATMPLIQTMAIRRALVGDEFLEGLASLDHLRLLEVTDIGITDDGLQHLSRLNGLRELALEDLDITDDGVQYLARLKQLKMLMVRDTRISDSGIEQLRQALPNCQISQ